MINDQIIALFNRGIVSRKALARVDVDRIALSAEEQTNWMPRTLGPMSLREGMEYIGECDGDGALLPFVIDRDDNAIIELTPSKLRIWNSGFNLLRRSFSVSTAITNGAFTTDLSGWTDADEGGVAASTWAAGSLQLVGTGTEAARRRQQVTVSGGDAGLLHALRIVVTRGPVLLRVGTSSGGDDLVSQAVLRTGTHSIGFTPSGSFWVELATTISYPCLVDSIEIEASGVVELPTIWDTAEKCKAVRIAQSNDVIYCASGERAQRIERRSNDSWSVVNYDPNNGPYEGINTENITLTPSDLTGAITLTASQPVFRDGMVGGVWQVASQGQRVEADLSAANTFSNPVLVTGTGAGRVLQIVRGGVWTGTLTLQRSVGDVGNWVDVKTYTTNGTENFNDGFDNSDIWYRVGFKTGEYTSGTAELSLNFPNSSIVGSVRLTAVASSTSASAVVLSPLGGTVPTTDWAEGSWSDELGHPTAVALYQGRLCWGGRGRLWTSISDAFSDFDPEFEGDAGPILRAIGDGPVTTVHWLLALERLMAGTSVQEQSIRSNSFDEPVTPSNYNSKTTSRKGAAPVPPVATNVTGYFVGRTDVDVYELVWRSDTYAYQPVKANLLAPEIGEATFVRLGMQEEPDVRLHCVRGDGTAAVMVRDQAEDVKAWVEVETDGFIEDVVVLPSQTEDRVFYRVRRTIDGVDVRYLERWGVDGNGVLLDCHRLFAVGGISGATVWPNLDWLEGKTVAVWAQRDGETQSFDLGTYTVTGGSITVDEPVKSIFVGLPYEARYKSAKMAIRTAMGIDMTKRKRLVKMGLVLADTHYQGLRYGSDFENMDELPLIERGTATPTETIWGEYDEDMFEFSGEWDTDARLCLKAASPRPCTVMAAVLRIDRS